MGLLPYAPMPRNPLLAEPLYRVKFVEKAGAGTTDMIADCRAAGLPEPTFERNGAHFVTTIWWDWLTDAVMDELGLNERQRSVLSIVKDCGVIDNRVLRDEMNVSESTALRELRRLSDAGILDRIGETGRSTHYRVARTKPVINPSTRSKKRNSS